MAAEVVEDEFVFFPKQLLHILLYIQWLLYQFISVSVLRFDLLLKQNSETTRGNFGSWRTFAANLRTMSAALVTTSSAVKQQ